MESEKSNLVESPSMETLLEETLGGEPRRGELREGEILSVRDDGLVVGIGAKHDGVVPKADLEQVADRTFEVGQKIPVIVVNPHGPNGTMELSVAQAFTQEDWLKAEQLKDQQEVYETVVLESNKGGLTVQFGHLRGFVPLSQLIGFGQIRQANERNRRLNGMVGQSIMLKVIEVNRRRERLILSQLAAEKEWRAARRKQLLEELEVGQVRSGRISQVTDFGLFVNLGGLDGLVHISELSWGHIDKPTDVFRVGQRVKVKVINLNRERRRIGLSIKALTPDPWESVPQRYHEGELREGKVSQLSDFGAFVELEPGVEGLLHNTELLSAEQRAELKPGDRVLVKVIRIEPDRRRIGLSARQVRREEWEQWAAEQAARAQEAAPEPQPVAELEEDEGELGLLEEAALTEAEDTAEAEETAEA